MQVALPLSGEMRIQHPHGHDRYQHRQCLAAHPGSSISDHFPPSIGRPFLCPGNYSTMLSMARMANLVGKKKYCGFDRVRVSILCACCCSHGLWLIRFRHCKAAGRNDAILGRRPGYQGPCGTGASSGAGGDRRDRLRRVGPRAAGRRPDHQIGQLALDS